MPHSTLKLIPGVDENRTLALNESAISKTQLVRFVPDKQNIGLVQKMGGWVKYFNSSIATIVRCLWAWEDTNAVTYLGVGCEGNAVNGNALSIISNGSRLVITPTTSTYNLGLNCASATVNTPFYYSISSISSSGGVATVNFNGYHFFKPGDWIYVNGSTNAVYNSAQYVTAAPAYNQVQFSVSGSPASATGGTLTYGDGITTVAGSPVVTFYLQNSNLNNYCSIYIKTPISIGGLVLQGVYPVLYLSPNSIQITATDALGNPQNATTTVSTYPGAGQLPVYNMIVGQSIVYVYLPNHGLIVGDTYTSLDVLNAGSVRVYGNYTVLGLGDSGGLNTTDYFSIGTNTTQNQVNPSYFTGNGSYATVTVPLGYTFNVGDQIVITNCPTAGFNTSGSTVVGVSTTSSTRLVTYANSTVGTVSGGLTSCFVSNILAIANSGLADVVIYKSPSPLPKGTGYGVAGYGQGGYGNGVVPPSYDAGTPITATDWTLDNWGSIFISCPQGGGIYEWNPNAGSTLASLIPQAPPVNDGMFVAMPQRQIIAWGSTFTGIQDPLLIRWCDVNDYNAWIALPTNQAGSYRLPRGSKVVGGIQGPQQGLIWTDLAVWAMQYSGPPYVYQFNEIGTGCGLISQKAAGSMNGVVYWMSQSQFYMLGPSGVQLITCPIWDVIFQDLDQSNLQKIRIAPNSRFGEVMWFYPTMSDGGEVSAYVKYNVALNQWDFGNLSRTAWINQSVLGPPIGAGIDDQGTYYIYQHEIGQDADGKVMDSSFQTGYFVLSDGEWKVFVDQVWPDMKWGLYNGNQNAHVNLTFYVTDYPTDTPRTYGPYNLSTNTEFVTPRFRGRLMSIKIESDLAETGTFWRLGAMRYRFEQDGKF
jgi:hypothetical protein